MAGGSSSSPLFQKILGKKGGDVGAEGAARGQELARMMLEAAGGNNPPQVSPAGYAYQPMYVMPSYGVQDYAGLLNSMPAPMYQAPADISYAAAPQGAAFNYQGDGNYAMNAPVFSSVSGLLGGK